MDVMSLNTGKMRQKINRLQKGKKLLDVFTSKQMSAIANPDDKILTILNNDDDDDNNNNNK